MSMRELLKKLVSVNIEIDGIVYPNEYADSLFIDRSMLDDEFVTHSERYAYYATLAEMADDRADRLKEDLEHLTSVLDHEKRMKARELQSQDPKFKMTETMFEHEVRLDKRYQEKLKEFQDARHLAKVLKSAPMAFNHRRDMLLELGRSRLVQMNDPKIIQNKQEMARNMMKRQVESPALPASDPVPSRRSPRKE